MVAKFVAEEGFVGGLTLALEGGDEWFIGRDPDVCQLIIEDPSASRKHLVCRTTPEGIILENLSDINPVQVNDKIVTEPLLLKNGDAVKIGEGKFRFYSEGEFQMQHEEDEKEKIVDEEEEAHETIYEETTDEDKGILAEIDFDLRETGRWLLKVIGGPNNGAEFSMQTGSSYLIGTDPTSCDIVFHDTSVSRQHARIAVKEDNTLEIEDLKSRNGTQVDGEPIEGKAALEPSTLINVGTTSFIVFDREGDMQTIISPLLPSIVKVLQKEDEEKTREENEQAMHANAGAHSDSAHDDKKQNTMAATVLIAIVTALFVVVGFGTMTLFQSEPIQKIDKVDYTAKLDTALAPFPSVRYSFNNNTGQLLLVGHVLTLSDKNQLLYNLQGLKFIKSRDDNGLVIDEYVWRETNQVLNRDPRWKGISVQSPEAGKFILTGYLQTRKQSEELSDYITANFPYLDRLDRRIIVEEDVVTTVEIDLENAGIRDINIQMRNGELSLSGSLSREQVVALDRMSRKFRELPGVRNIKTFITEIEAAEAMINISDRYTVSGFSNLGGGKMSVVINGRILTNGDVLDGMIITDIRPTAIYLEKGATKYRIDFNQG